MTNCLRVYLYLFLQVTAVKVALSSGTQNQKIDSVMAKPLKEQAFATPEKMAELVQKVCHIFNSCFASLFGGYSLHWFLKIFLNLAGFPYCIVKCHFFC